MWEAVYRGLKRADMKKKDKTDIDPLITGLRKAQDLRVFPNGRQLTSFESVAINQIGKAVESIWWVLRQIVYENKKPREFLSIIVKMQREIDYRINSTKKRR